MTSEQLTGPGRAATIQAMRRRCGRTMMVMAGGAALVGCVSVKAPDKPIVIELNINIKQEVIYRLAEDAGNTIKANPEIF